MRYRIPCRSAPQRNPQTRTICALPSRNAAHNVAHNVAHKPRTNCAQCRAVCAQCRTQPAARPPCNLCAVSRTIRCSSVAQSVRSVAHGPQLFRRAMPRTMSRTIRAQTVCNAAHYPQHFRRAICAQCSAQAAALLLRSLCAMQRTIRRSSVVQSVRNAAHGPPLFRRAVCAQCRAQPAAQCSPSSRTIGCRCNLPPTPCCRNRH